jgi:hypothetical protein
MTTKRELLPQGGICRERTAEQIAAAEPFGLDYPPLLSRPFGTRLDSTREGTA